MWDLFQDKRITAVDALAHPYLDEGRLRYHSCMCKCCHNTPTGRQYTNDFEPFCNQPFTYTFEDELTSISKVKGTLVNSLTGSSAWCILVKTSIANPIALNLLQSPLLLLLSYFSNARLTIDGKYTYIAGFVHRALIYWNFVKSPGKYWNMTLFLVCVFHHGLFVMPLNYC